MCKCKLLKWEFRYNDGARVSYLINLLSSSQALRQCYFHLLLKRCRSVWEFDNKILSDGHTVVKRTFRGIWSIITFNVIPPITNSISKNLPPSGIQWLPLMTYIHPLLDFFNHILTIFSPLLKFRIPVFICWLVNTR